MQAVLDIFCAFVVALAAAAFAQFGVQAAPKTEAAEAPEVRRTVERRVSEQRPAVEVRRTVAADPAERPQTDRSGA